MERRKLARERRRNIAVGLTTLLGLGGLIVLLTAFGYVPGYFRDSYQVTLYMDNIAGLQANSKVMLWGRIVGEVESVGFSEPDAPARAYVTLLIDQAFEIPEDVEVRVEKPPFAGGPVVSLVNGMPGGKTLATDGSAQLRNSTVIDPIAEIEKFGRASEDISELKTIWVGVGENLNQLFGSGQTETPSLPRVVIGLEQRLDELQRVIAGAEAWVGDEQLRSDVTASAANAREVTETLGQTVTKLEERYLALAEAAETKLDKVDTTLDSAGRTLDGAATSITEIEKRYVALADEASKVMAVIDGLVAKADNKDSTIGLLLSDPRLYNNLTDTSERLKLMLDEAQLLIEKWQDEGIKFRLFD